MRRISITLAASLALLWGGNCFAFQYRPKMIRVCVQLIEIPHPALTELLGGGEISGSILHAKAIALTKEGNAKLVDTSMVICRSGEKATIESIAEIIYPTEYNPTCVGLFGPAELALQPQSPPLRPFPFIAFETHNTGASLEVEPTIGENDQIIDLRLVPEWGRLDRFETWMEYHDDWGDTSLRKPIFETWRANTAVNLLAGKFELASIISPKPQAPAPAVLRKLLLFVRADVIQSGI